MRADEIVDRESFYAWLRARPESLREQEAIALGSLWALRVFPHWVDAMQNEWAREANLAIAPTARSILTSSVTAKLRTDEASLAADAAREGCKFVDPIHKLINPVRKSAWVSIRTASSAACAAARVANAHFGSAPASARDVDVCDVADAASKLLTWEFLRSDCEKIESGWDVLQSPLWAKNKPVSLKKAWQDGRDWMQSNPGHDFWIRWYEAILAGRPLTGDWESHWQLLHDIALIPDADWEKGAEHVAGIIEEIEAKYAGAIDNSSSETVAVTSADPAPFNACSSAFKVIDAISRDEIKATLARNKTVLPANLGAISSLTELELVRIERLRGDNSLPENLRDELKFHSEMLQTLLVAFDQMKERVEGFRDAPSDEDAEAAKSLIKHFIEMGQKWPRENAEELVDSAYRNVLGAAGNGFRACGMFGLYSLMTLFLPIAPGIAAPIAGAIFGVEKVTSTLVKHLGKND